MADFTPPNLKRDKRTPYEKELDRVAASTIQHAPQVDQGGITQDYLRGIFDRLGVDPVAYGEFQTVTVPAVVAGKPGKSTVQFPTDVLFDTLTVWSVDNYSTAPNAYNFASGQICLRIDGDDNNVPVFPGAQIRITGARQITIYNQFLLSSFNVIYTLSRNSEPLPPAVAWAITEAGILRALRVTDANPGRLLVEDQHADDETRVDWWGTASGIGSATNNLVYTPPGGATYEVCDVFVWCPGTATFQRASWKFGLLGTYFCERGGRPPQDLAHPFGGTRGPRSAGVELYVDIAHTGTASPWTAVARGFYLS